MSIKTLPLHANGHEIFPQHEVRVVDMSDVGPDVPPMLVEHLFNCAWCGLYPTTEVRDGAVHVNGDPCPTPSTGYTTVTQLKVPSGKIIVTDDLRPIYDGFDHAGFASYNSALGQAQVVEAFAELGCAFGAVGNTCPGLFRTGTDQYVIAAGAYDEEREEAEENEGYPEGWKHLAGVCTDLWAYSIADYEDWKAKGGDPETLGWSDAVVEIPAGTYEFTFHGGEKGFDRDDYTKPVIFTHIKKVA